jgi:hypothetical protein
LRILKILLRDNLLFLDSSNIIFTSEEFSITLSKFSTSEQILNPIHPINWLFLELSINYSFPFALSIWFKNCKKNGLMDMKNANASIKGFRWKKYIFYYLLRTFEPNKILTSIDFSKSNWKNYHSNYFQFSFGKCYG